MNKIFLLFYALTFTTGTVIAQKIIPIEYKGKKYEAIDMKSSFKITWGGYHNEIPGKAARSKSNGAANTTAIVAAVGDNTLFDGKIYAAKFCSDTSIGNKDDWYLPGMDEADAIYAFKQKFSVPEKGSIWTSTEFSATQAVTKYWYNGTFYNSMKVDQFHLVCIRKVD
ncbi:MAG: hypothetical protein ABIR30_02785 [Chitinophagaceae bacterium]